MSTTLFKRKSIRLKDYDYQQPGSYFLTICVQDRECLFGDVVDGEMRLNQYGEIVMRCWNDLPHHYPNVALDVCVVMPNHFHGVVTLTENHGSNSGVGAGLKPAPTSKKRHGLSEIVRAFKTFSSRKINALRNTPGIPVWQRNYFERVVRNENELFEIREYIQQNPLKWDLDPENPNVKA